MSERKYITEHLNKKTYLKGRFVGKFAGQLDKEKSDEAHERFFNLQIVEGHIYTTQNDIKKWPEEEFPEFKKISTFPTKPPGEIKVTLGYLDHSEKHFTIKVQEFKLVNCLLTKQVYEGKEVFGTLEGDVSGYMLHRDTILHEIIEQDSTPTPGPIIITKDNPEELKNTDATQTDTIRRPVHPIYNPKKKSMYLSFLSTVFWLSLLVGFAIIFKHWVLILLFMGMACLTMSVIYNPLARFFNSHFSNRLVGLLYTSLFVAALLLLITFYKSDNQKGFGPQIAAQKRLNKKADFQNNQQNKDSFNYYFSTAKSLAQKQTINEALKALSKASLFATAEEKAEINTEENRIYASVAEKSVKEKNYKEAIQAYTALLTGNNSNLDYLYKRASCYIESGNIKEAVTDLKRAIDLGDKPALLLYNKINPIKKRIAYYVTRCCDGSISNSKGQGACSHHGGVCDWSEPVYEEYRKY